MEHEEDEDEEEEDVDFNPLLKGSPSLEASSSLSSEVEGLDADLSDSGCEKSHLSAFNQSSDTIGDGVGTSNFQEQILVQSAVSSGEQSDPKLQTDFGPEPNGRKSDLISESENGVVLEKECGSSSGADVTNDFLEENIDTVKFRMLGKPLDDDEDDAICKRTRARYSLANFTLDELEAFLQETDDDDDLPNVDEEEEYKKFLAAVLQDGGGDADQAIVDSGNDEDEDTDADFELEIEEALESDDDDYLVNSSKKGSSSTVRRPETRQNKRQKFSVDGKDKVSQSGNKPLRPLVPVFSSGMIAPLPSHNGQYSVLENACNLPSLSHSCPVNVFTPNQIGQLYCLIHEHVQLLIQVYSLSVLEPSRKNIASQIQGLLSEMLHKRDQALTWRKIPHSSFCFHLPHNHPSFLEGPPSWPQPQENTSESSQSIDGQSDVPPTYNDFQCSADPQTCISSHKHPMKESVSSIQAVQNYFWFPFVGGPVLSVLDVAPLKLVGKYMDDVSIAVNEQMRRYVESTGDLHSEKQPLFPLPSSPSHVEANVEITKGTTCSEHGGVISSSSNHRPPKKTLAATLVESTKKQSVALVPKRIAELARQFYPLLNPALFPHKPPLLAIANRVLFTDSEDELLAMGLLEYNTDWKAIQQRFLPCKSKHQIFVRQKNRCSSKAPENPIKAVRRLKTSPLTAEEKARIFEGIKTYKLDWMSIWKLIVPYRDPSLLPRQWRIAIGTQKSYKVDPSKREKRRLYEWKRRQNKRLAPDVDDENGAIGQQNEHEEEDCMEKDNEVRAHEFLLSDCRPVQPVPPTAICEPSTSNCNSEMLPRASSNCNSELLPRALVPGESNVERPGSHGICEPSPVRDNHNCDPFPQNVLSRSCYTSRNSQMETMRSSEMATKSLRYEPVPRPYRARRPRSYQMVRLAPELPPVNLPPSVRVISQAAFKNLHRLPSGMEKSVTSPSCVGNSASDSTNMNPQKKSCSANQENSYEPEMGMHSFRSHNPEPCLTLSNCDKAASHQINLSPLPQHPQKVGSGSCKTFLSDLKKSTHCGLNFRQPVDNVNDGFVAACQASRLGVNQCERSGDAVPCNGPINELDSGINLHSVLRKEKDLTPTGTEVILPRDDGHGCLMTGAGDQSLPEIVMEQEELSDSDEEIEHVEFECEEMADSEGEEEL